MAPRQKSYFFFASRLVDIIDTIMFTLFYFEDKDRGNTMIEVS